MERSETGAGCARLSIDSVSEGTAEDGTLLMVPRAGEMGEMGCFSKVSSSDMVSSDDGCKVRGRCEPFQVIAEGEAGL